MSELLEIFSYEFMQRALAAGVAIAVLAPVIGSFLVVRRYSLLADTLAHVSLLGVAVGVAFDSQPLVVAVVVAILGALLIEYLRLRRGLFGESLLAMMLSGSLALAAVIFSATDNSAGSVVGFLFGSITTVSATDVWVVGVLAVVMLAVLWVFYRELFLVSFDEDFAKVQGVRAEWFHSLLVVIAAVTVSVSLRIVGSLLVGALMIIPVLSAMQLRQSFSRTVVASVGYGVSAMLSGIAVSYVFDLAAGGTIVVMSLLLFVLSVVGRAVGGRG